MTLMRGTPPYEDESGFGYYRRLAAENAFGSWRELAGLAKVARARSALFSAPNHVATELGLEMGWTRLATMQEEVTLTWRGLRRTQGDAICPMCLTDAAYIRRHWEHGFVTACPLHRVLLVDRCPACRNALSIHRERIEQCSCGQDLRVQETSPCRDTQQWLSTLIATDGHSTAGISPRLRRVDVGNLCVVVRTLCLFADPNAPPPTRNSAAPKSVAEAVELLRPLDWLLAEWPKGFGDHVAERIAAGRPGARTLNNLLGPWYRHIKGACQSKELEPFLQEVITVAARDFDGTLGLDITGRVVGHVTAHYRIAETAVAMGIGREQLLKAVKAGAVQHRTSRFGTRGLVYEIPESEVQRILRSRAQWMTEDEASSLTKVPPSVLRNMVEAGVVVSDSHWRRDICKGGPIERESLSNLLNLLRCRVNHRTSNGDEVRWSELSSRRLGDKKAIQSVMRAAVEGRLRGLRRARHLGLMSFSRSDLAPYFGTPVLEAGLSVHQLAKLTGWKWETIDHWLAVGVLDAESITLRGQPCRVVLPAHLLDFHRAYLPLADLAKAMGTKSSYLIEQLAPVEVVGAKVLENGVRRGGLLRMSDLGRLAVVGAQSQGAGDKQSL